MGKGMGSRSIQEPRETRPDDRARDLPRHHRALEVRGERGHVVRHHGHVGCAVPGLVDRAGRQADGRRRATDYRIAIPDVRLCLPGDGEATWPGMAVFRLVQQAGVARARRTILFGQPAKGRCGELPQ